MGVPLVDFSYSRRSSGTPDTEGDRNQPVQHDDRQLHLQDRCTGQVELVPGQGFRGGSGWAMADRSRGPRNGVLTAVDDFIAEKLAAGRPLAFAHVPAIFGLDVLST